MQQLECLLGMGIGDCQASQMPRWIGGSVDWWAHVGFAERIGEQPVIKSRLYARRTRFRCRQMQTKADASMVTSNSGHRARRASICTNAAPLLRPPFCIARTAHWDLRRCYIYKNEIHLPPMNPITRSKPPLLADTRVPTFCTPPSDIPYPQTGVWIVV